MSRIELGLQPEDLLESAGLSVEERALIESSGGNVESVISRLAQYDEVKELLTFLLDPAGREYEGSLLEISQEVEYQFLENAGELAHLKEELKRTQETLSGVLGSITRSRDILTETLGSYGVAFEENDSLSTLAARVANLRYAEFSQKPLVLKKKAIVKNPEGTES